MNTLLWIFQGLLALHTALGAIWKFSNSVEQTMPSLKAIPNGAWLTMSRRSDLRVHCLRPGIFIDQLVSVTLGNFRVIRS